jgi:hypothetical protein
MRPALATLLAPVLVSVLVPTLAGCGGDEDPEPRFTFGSTRVAPPEGKGYGTLGSETSPNPEESVLELELDSRATVVLWIDEDERRVWQQHSDPEDPDAWTEPGLLFEAGDGCHGIEGATNGETVAATLECYANDLFVQQAPDQGQAVVTRDLEDWQVHDGGELYGEPVVSHDGDEVTWPEDGLTWSESDGFH